MPQRRKSELLAPAGDLQRLQAAYDFGADAAYMGGARFGLRKNADNSNDDELQQAVDLARSMRRHLYITLNSMPLQRDIPALRAYIGVLNEIQPHAVIVADPGVVALVRELSTLRIHLSTQASCINSSTASWWARRGVSRLVLARELSITEAAVIRDNSDLEVEIFCHGSQCASHSGKCVISNYTAGRDANRGGCVQTCRETFAVSDPVNGKEYQAPIMNARDLNGLELIPDCLAQGIDSLKIEGRMKSTLYVAAAVSAYRHAIDAAWTGETAKAGWAQLLAETPARHHGTGGLANRLGPESIDLHAGTHGSLGWGGQVLHQRNDHEVIIEIRAPLETNMPCWWLRPGAEPIADTLSGLHDLNGKALDSVNGNRCIRVTSPSSMPKGSLLVIEQARPLVAKA